MSFLRIFITLFHFNRTNWKAVALCFVTATVFWLFNALNKNYSAHLRFPIQFQYDQDQYAPAAELPKTLTINVSGNGWDLVRKTFGVKLQVLSIPLEHPDEIKRIHTSVLPPLLATQLGDLKINFIAVDTLRIQIEPRVTRHFKLVADDRDLSFRNNAGRSSAIVVLPDSVELTGPASLLRNRPDSIVLLLPVKKVQENYREEVEVLVPHIDLIKRNPPVVEVRFDVTPFVTVDALVSIEKPTLPWGLVIEDDSVHCQIKIPATETSNFPVRQELIAIVPAADLPTVALPKGNEQWVLPSVQGLGPYMKLVQIDSVRLKQH